MNTIKKTLAIKLLIIAIIIGMLIVNYYTIYIDPAQKLCYNNNIVKEEKIIIEYDYKLIGALKLYEVIEKNNFKI